MIGGREMHDVCVIERALALARHGSCLSLDDIRRTLAREHYTNIDAHLSGLTIRRQLRTLLQQRRAMRPLDPG